MKKKFVGKKTKTQVKITPKGQVALEKHWLQLESFRATVKKSKSE
jgi:hypothetical protein